MLTIVLLLTSEIRSHGSRTVTCQSSSISCSCSNFSLFQPKPKADQNAIHHGRLYVHTWTLWPTFAHFLCPYTVSHRLRITDDKWPLALKKWITACNLHLAREARGSSNVNGCPIKTEHYSRLGFVWIWRGGSQATR